MHGIRGSVYDNEMRQPWIIIGILVLGIAAIVWFFNRRPKQ